jgi:hypothetical protein
MLLHRSLKAGIGLHDAPLIPLPNCVDVSGHVRRFGPCWRRFSKIRPKATDLSAQTL